MDDLYADEPEVNRVRNSHGGRGASDAPTAQVAVLLSRLYPIVYANDKHLSRPKVAPKKAVLLAADGADQAVRAGESAVVSVTVVAGGSMYGLERAAVGLGSALGFGPWVSRTALGLLGVWLMSSKTRRTQIAEHGTSILEYVGTQVENAERALPALILAAAPVNDRNDLEARIAEMFVRDLTWRGPALAGDVQAALVNRNGNAESDAEVRAVLVARACFVEGPRYRFSLGRIESPQGGGD